MDIFVDGNRRCGCLIRIFNLDKKRRKTVMKGNHDDITANGDKVSLVIIVDHFVVYMDFYLWIFFLSSNKL